VGWAIVGALPFVALLMVEQHAATGGWFTPTQSLYFARSDWPASCHRLGFGPDVGCTVEHPGPTSRLGGDGYDLRDALRITRERAGSLGEDLVGWGPLLLVGFAPLVVFASSVDAFMVSFVLALTVAYGLFYYGNAMFFDARHLFPAATFAWLLVARGATLAQNAAVRGAGIVGVMAIALGAGFRPWATRTSGAAEFQATRSDLGRTFRAQGIATGILKTRDLTSFAAAFDPWSADGSRIVALDDNAGLLELRRAHPQLPVFLSLPGDAVGRLYVAAPPPGVAVELERSWPVFIRPNGLAARQLTQDGASGGSVLLLSHATPGARVEVAFETSMAATYAVRVDAAAGPDEGDYTLELDGHPLPDLHGYAAVRGWVRGEPAKMPVPAARHVLVVRCLGRDPQSAGYDGRLDALIGDVATP
jgi:hypothetical protein